jgi:hypothetical protein
MSPARFETAVPASERPQTHDLDRGATGISISVDIRIIIGYQKIPQHIINELHKTATLGTAHILREVLMYSTKCVSWETALHMPYIVTTE